MKRFALPIAILILTTAGLLAQSFQIKNYGIEEGLCHEGTFSLIQDTDGFIWIGTNQGLCRFNGQTFQASFSGDTISPAISDASYTDSKGRVWFGHNDGSISVFVDGSFRVFKNIDGVNSAIIEIAEDEKGNVLAMSQQNGVIRFSPDLKMTLIQQSLSETFVSDFHVCQDGTLLVGGFTGLDLYTFNEDSISYDYVAKVEGLPFTRIQTIEAGLVNGTYWVGTEDEGLFFVKGSGIHPDSYQVEKAGVEHGLEYSSISSILVDERGFLWVSDYGVGVYRFGLKGENTLSARLDFKVEGGMPEEYIRRILKDDEGNIWFAAQSKGISVLRDQAFTFYDFEASQDVPQISAISSLEGSTYLGSKDGVIMWIGASLEERRFFTPMNGLPVDEISSLWEDDNGDVYIGTARSGVYYKRAGSDRISRFFLANNSLGNMINEVIGDARGLWVASNNGVYQLRRGDANIIQHQSTSTGLPHNLIHDIIIDQNDDVWIATRSNGLSCITSEKSFNIGGSARLEFMSLDLDAEGNIWAASKEDGVFKFTQDSLYVYSLEQGLKAKYTYAVGVDNKGKVWVGHRLGLSKIDPELDLVSVFGPEMGFTSDILGDAIVSSPVGYVIFGTSEGLIIYDPNQSVIDTLAPRLSVTEILISDSLHNLKDDIRLPYGTYKLRIDFIGINMSNPDQVSYRYKLDGFDDWSEPTTEISAKYSRIEDGHYTFMLQACDGNGNCTGEVEMFKLYVKIPIWKAWWFILSLLVLSVGGVYFYIKWRERRQKALQEYLETQLEERTREVIQKKEEIEDKNRDITDSINYAQRIQASILPPIKRLHNAFSGSFVFYQPRDIVSGDFYWYDKIDDDRFMIVCADSTGHGVPGAFMSMIGTTLIKDISLREDVNTPSDVLMTLDAEVREALNQNKETDGSNDGMDIIVAEINMKTNRFIVSSAMRPVILYKNGEQIYVKGSRSSVGGQLDEDSMKKEFSNEVFDLNKGDIIYMFSDGYPDQFGGPLGRKFKMVRLKNLLRDINDKPMDEQYNYIKSNFFLWKEDLEQVDDVLFMGIKI